MKIKYIISVILIFIIGMYIGHKNVPNYIYHTYLKYNEGMPPTPLINLLDTTQFQERIRIKDKNDIDTLKKILINKIWQTDKIPTNIKPFKIEKNSNIKHQFNPNLIEGIDRITIVTNEVISSNISIIKPQSLVKHEAMIYHNGHGEDPEIEIRCINRLLEEGYMVIRIHMPLKGENEIPVYNFKLMGNIKIENHKILNYFQNPYPSYFSPISGSINYVKEAYNIQIFHIMGISGGGWVAQLYAAMDTTILRSYSIAGSVPIEYRFFSPYDWGDAEQHDHRIFAHVSYPEIYVLGSNGKHRSQVHILNQYDPCCFKAEAGKYYKKAICEKINYLKSGEFIFLADSTEKSHTISEYALNYIIEHLTSDYKDHKYHACTDDIW
jgi:hypothetical protein